MVLTKTTASDPFYKEWSDNSLSLYPKKTNFKYSLQLNS